MNQVLSNFFSYCELTKPRLVSLVILSVLIGFWLAVPVGQEFPWPLFISTLIGATLSSAGSMTLNQWMEIEQDALMKRTAARPLPEKRVTPLAASVFGWTLVFLGVGVLAIRVNTLASIISAVTVISYLGCYTPLKMKTVHATWIGAVPGALPPLIGWAAAESALPPASWMLFGIIFFWQIPHFMAISWMYREDFKNAGFQMLAVLDQEGKEVARTSWVHTILLIPVSLMPFWLGVTGRIYFFGALVLDAFFLKAAWDARKSLNTKARTLFRTSILYLTLLFILMAVNKVTL